MSSMKSLLSLNSFYKMLTSVRLKVWVIVLSGVQENVTFQFVSFWWSPWLQFPKSMLFYLVFLHVSNTHLLTTEVNLCLLIYFIYLGQGGSTFPGSQGLPIALYLLQLFYKIFFFKLNSLAVYIPIFFYFIICNAIKLSLCLI